jgi:hypothetical protein
LIAGWQMIWPLSKDTTNEDITDVDGWADARRLRINRKLCSKPRRCVNPLAGSR